SHTSTRVTSCPCCMSACRGRIWESLLLDTSPASCPAAGDGQWRRWCNVTVAQGMEGDGKKEDLTVLAGTSTDVLRRGGLPWSSFNVYVRDTCSSCKSS